MRKGKSKSVEEIESEGWRGLLAISNRSVERVMSYEKTETRYVREIIFGRRGKRTYWEFTTDTETLPKNSTSFIMSNIPNLKYHNVGNIYGDRTWVEYGFRQCKSELG